MLGLAHSQLLLKAYSGEYPAAPKGSVGREFQYAFRDSGRFHPRGIAGSSGVSTLGVDCHTAEPKAPSLDA